MSSEQETRAERGRVYGDYYAGIKLESLIMGLLNDHHKEENNGLSMEIEEFTMISKIVLKLVRIAVTPDHVDSWHDLGCYAHLNEDFIKKDTENDTYEPNDG